MSATATDPNLKHLHTAREQIAKGDLKNAAKTLNKAQKQMPNDARVFMLAGVMAEKSGNPKGALDALRRAVTLAPDWGPGLLELALFYARQDQFDPAIETAEKLVELEPKNLRVLAGVVDIAHRANRPEMAVRHLRRGLELVPGDATLRHTLARDLSGMGENDEAIAIWSALIDENPADTEALTGRVQTHIAQGNPALALQDTGTLLQLAPGDSVYAYYNALAHGATPSHQPAELNRGMFDGMAEMYDLHMVRGLKYRLPQQMAAKITALYPDKKLNILDLGCGTGLLGVFLGRIDGFLIGVDISKNMLAQAARHQVYDRFHNVNLLDALEDTPAALYQAITALDVFIYAGDLSGAIPNALRILTPGGHLMFSCETAPEDGPDLLLQANGRYAHKRSEVLALCQAAGFVSIEAEDTELRQENHQPVQGFTVVAQKPALP